MRHLALAALLTLCPRGAPALERILVAVGQNRGLVGDPVLRYAEQDAERFARVMVALGGVEAPDVYLRPGLTAEGFRALLGEVRARLSRGPEDGRELLIYVSSHAADGRLHLAGSELALAELQAFVEAAPAQIGVLIVDACQAGVVTQGKGLVPDSGPVAVLRPRVEGRAFIASARADQKALESDTLRGSYFTAHLVAGLRGPADSTRDGRVDLSEAFTYAYNRTVEATVGALPEPQAPSYLQNLRGTGQLVLTDTRLARALVQIAFHPASRWVVTRLDATSPVEEFIKAQGEASLAVEPGRYRFVTALADGMHVGAEVEAREGRRVTLREAALGRLEAADTPDAWSLRPHGWRSSDRLFLLPGRGRLNGQTIDEDHRVLDVCPGERIRGQVVVEAFNEHDNPRAIVPIVSLATWQRPREDFKLVNANTPQGRHLHPFEVDLVAPERPGEHFIVFASAGQTEPHYIASRTTWTMGRSLWDDGRDLSDLGARELERERAEGRVFLLETRQDGPVLAPYGIASVRVSVRGDGCR